MVTGLWNLLNRIVSASKQLFLIVPNLTQTWEQRKFGEMVQFSKGSGYSKGDLKESGTPIILYGQLYTKPIVGSDSEEVVDVFGEELV